MNTKPKEPLLRVEFGRDALRATDRPLEFIIRELGAIAERIPPELRVDVNTARIVRVTIETE